MGEYHYTILLKLLISAVLGGIIGFERERHNRWAGFRTHILVCLGSCLIMITSIEMARVFPDSNADPGRLAAQVVSGIGFLGAGTILHSSSRIRGLTTAATLWTMAGIGLAVGLGSYTAAVATTILTFVVLAYFGHWETIIKRSKLMDRWIIELQIPQGNESTHALFLVLEKYDMTINSIQIDQLEDLNKAIIDIQAPPNFDESRFISEIQSKLQSCSTNLKKC
jgi:putative Mg2+ transporter-C (MgtC) family protein